MFAECHGKSSRDSHFSIIDLFLKEESNLKQLTSTNDVISAINKQQSQSNNWRKTLGLDPITTIAIEFRPQLDNYIAKYRKIPNLKTYYNFFTDSEFKLRTCVISDLTKSFKLYFLDSSELKINNNNIISSVEKKIQNIVFEVDKLKLKQTRILNILTKEKDIKVKYYLCILI